MQRKRTLCAQLSPSQTLMPNSERGHTASLPRADLSVLGRKEGLTLGCAHLPVLVVMGTFRRSEYNETV